MPVSLGSDESMVDLVFAMDSFGSSARGRVEAIGQPRPHGKTIFSDTRHDHLMIRVRIRILKHVFFVDEHGEPTCIRAHYGMFRLADGPVRGYPLDVPWFQVAPAD